MKRALWAVPVIMLAAGVWLARANYSYYLSQAMYPVNTSTWTLYQVPGYNVPYPVYSDCYGGYCGVYGRGMIMANTMPGEVLA